MSDSTAPAAQLTHARALAKVVELNEDALIDVIKHSRSPVVLDAIFDELCVRKTQRTCVWRGDRAFSLSRARARAVQCAE